MTTDDEPTTPKRRTKRRYAYELYPHAKEDEVRPLAVEVPYLYAQAIGWQATETGWVGVDREVVSLRFALLCMARERALLADAMLQGLRGDKAWRWVQEHLDDSGELVWDRAVHCGVPADAIKPFPCGPEPDDHYCGMGGIDGWRRNVPGKESECEHCTEAIP